MIVVLIAGSIVILRHSSLSVREVDIPLDTYEA